MKKLTYIFLIGFLFTACASYRTLDLSKLTTGMTKAQVIERAGSPERILAVNDTDNGYQEVLQYTTGRGEIYALEFWGDYLTGYEYLQDDVRYYVPAAYPPAVLPPYGRPVVIIHNTYRPETNRPPQYQRPPATNNRPGVTTPPSTGGRETSRTPSSSSSSSSTTTRRSTEQSGANNSVSPNTSRSGRSQ
ncbi:MAG: hypothetical protein LIO97_01385 [Tannerellaceae bacterium]|nr:hypothetical protein [Tannerellaceae bacterium]